MKKLDFIIIALSALFFIGLVVLFIVRTRKQGPDAPEDKPERKPKKTQDGKEVIPDAEIVDENTKSE